MSWLYVFISRFAVGQRWRKTRPSETRYGASLFVVIAVYFGIALLAIHLSPSFGAFMQQASPTTLWVAAVTVVSLLSFVSVLWAKRVPTRVSVALAVIAWVVLLSLVYYFEWRPHSL